MTQAFGQQKPASNLHADRTINQSSINSRFSESPEPAKTGVAPVESPSFAIETTTSRPVSSVQNPSGLESTKSTYEDPRVALREEQKRNEDKLAKQEELKLQEEITQLSKRDREVRAHEQAHMAVGGQYAGAASYDFQRGPNGVNYAVGGEVPISTSAESTPELTMRKARVIRAAALAPAEPSPQDRKVAAMATQMEAEARSEIAKAQKEEANLKTEKTTEETEVVNPALDATSKAVEPSEPDRPPPTGLAELDNVRRIFSSAEKSTGLLLTDHA